MHESLKLNTNQLSDIYYGNSENSPVYKPNAEEHKDSETISKAEAAFSFVNNTSSFDIKLINTLSLCLILLFLYLLYHIYSKISLTENPDLKTKLYNYYIAFFVLILTINVYAFNDKNKPYILSIDIFVLMVLNYYIDLQIQSF